jgi:heme exporter protein D
LPREFSLMDRIDAFFAMGGYAAYVWPAFAIALVVMLGLLVQSVATYRKRQRELALLESEEE